MLLLFNFKWFFILVMYWENDLNPILMNLQWVHFTKCCELKMLFSPMLMIYFLAFNFLNSSHLIDDWFLGVYVLGHEIEI